MKGHVLESQVHNFDTNQWRIQDLTLGGRGLCQREWGGLKIIKSVDG